MRDEEDEDARLQREVEAELEEMATDEEAALQIGRKVLEMVDRLDKVAAAVPGAQARWHFEVEERRYMVVLSVADA